METIGTQTKKIYGKDVEIQTEVMLVYSKETQIEPCLVEDTEMQTKDPYVFSQETQIDQPTVNVVVQIDGEESIPTDCCINQEVAEDAVQNEPMET